VQEGHALEVHVRLLHLLVGHVEDEGSLVAHLLRGGVRSDTERHIHRKTDTTDTDRHRQTQRDTDVHR
jgi:hypothetical protein